MKHIRQAASTFALCIIAAAAEQKKWHQMRARACQSARHYPEYADLPEGEKQEARDDAVAILADAGFITASEKGNAYKITAKKFTPTDLAVRLLRARRDTAIRKTMRKHKTAPTKRVPIRRIPQEQKQ